MRPILLTVLLASLAACGSSSVGACSRDSDCAAGATCTAQHVCVAGTPVIQPDVTVTAPTAGAVADGTLAVAAIAHAPGGVTSLSFEVRTTAGALLASAAGSAAAADPASFSATVRLAGAADGSAIVQAVMTYGSAQKLTSGAVQILLDQRPPVITLQTDGRTTLLAGGQNATVTAQIGDGPGTGVVDSSVVLRIANHADVVGTGSAGLYTFSLPMDDSLAPAGATTTVPFQILATDRLGHTATTVAGDPRAVVRVDRDAPQISEISVITDPGFTKPDGTKVFDTAGGLMKVQATVTDGAGLDESTVCLRAAGETGACPHLGTNHGAGNLYDFDLPRPVGSFDGQSVAFTLSADDAFAVVLPDGPKAEHQASSAPQPVVFDNTPPVVTVTPDTNVYARSGTIDVVVTITDGTGVGTVQLVSRTAAPVTNVGSVYTFKLNAGDAPLLLDGSFAFNVVAQDNLRHSTSVAATREIDGAPPALSLQIFRTGDRVPATTGVTYPAPVPNTGWTGSTFIYSDSIHVHGTLTDRSGVGSAALHVDGIALFGGPSAGIRQPLALDCAAGPTTCTFDTNVNLNAPGNGDFHSGDGNAGNILVGADSVPAGVLQIAIDAQDTATSFGGTAVPNKGTQATPVQATRLLWEQAVAGTAVTGLAVHPSGDVIVTTSGAAGDVYALAPDAPLLRWNGAATVGPIAGISGTPAVGSGDPASARIYVASAAGVLYAFDPTGSLVWTSSTGAPFSVGPAVASVGTPAIDEIVIPDAAAPAKAGAPVSQLWRGTSATDVSGVPSDEQDVLAAPLILGGNVYFATQHAPKSTSPTETHVTMHGLNPDGTLGASTKAVAGPAPSVVVNGIDPFFGLVTDGSNVYAATSGKTSGSLFAFDSALSQIWKASLAQSLAAGPTFGADGKLYGADGGKNINTYNLTTGAPTPFASAIGGTGMVPLQGSAGHIYVPRSSGQGLLAYKNNQLSWELNIGTAAANMLRYAVIDCQGRLFSAAGNTVYAFVTDDQGLADTPWPNLRRDSRNTGNANAAKYGMVTAGGCTQ